MLQKLNSLERREGGQVVLLHVLTALSNDVDDQ